MGNGTFQNVSREKGHFILWETGHSTLWERNFPLGIGPLILWDSGIWESVFNLRQFINILFMLKQKAVVE